MALAQVNIVEAHDRNENKMSDGGRQRALIGVKVF
jgi:ABC-type cobalamin/Fe3+-siderophores transport system ATPase subunit